MSGAAAAADFTRWCRTEVFTPAIVEGTRLLERALDLYLLQLYSALDLHRQLAAPRSAASLATALGFHPSAGRALEALLLRLGNSAVVNVQHQAGIAVFCAGSRPAFDAAALARIHSAMAELGEEHLCSLEFLAFGAEHFVKALKDDPLFMDRVLTGAEREFAGLWDRATNLDPMQNVHGLMGARAVAMLFRGGTLLEIGGGTGNGIVNVLTALQSSGQLAALTSYIFTDISMPFVLGTRHKVRAAFPPLPCEWRHLDINKPFDRQKIPPHSADLIYGVNAAHIGRNTVSVLQRCRQTLKPGGLVVFAERVRQSGREMAPRELVLNLSQYHRTAAQLDCRYRPGHAYLSLQGWRRALQLAGFSAIEIWPDFAAFAGDFAELYAAVIVAKA